MLHRVGVIGALVLLFGIANASHPGTSVGYELFGFSADGKHAFFKKTTSSMMFSEHWLAVYDAGTTKLLTSQPVYRNCGEDPDNPAKREPDDPPPPPNGGCDHGTPIGKKTGAKTEEQIYKKYGAVSAASMLATKSKPDAIAVTDLKGSGQLQTFAGTGVDVRVKSKATDPLPDATRTGITTAGFDLEVTLAAGATTWSVKHRVYVDAKQDSWNGNILRFEQLFVEKLAVAAGNKAVALVFSGKPIVLVPPAPKPVSKK